MQRLGFLWSQQTFASFLSPFQPQEQLLWTNGTCSMSRGWSQNGCWRREWRTMPPSRCTLGPKWCSEGLLCIEASSPVQGSLPGNQQKLIVWQSFCCYFSLYFICSDRIIKGRIILALEYHFWSDFKGYVFTKCLLDSGLALLLGSVCCLSLYLIYGCQHNMGNSLVTCLFQSLTFRRVT